MRSTMQNSVRDKLNAWEKEGGKQINAAQDGDDGAQRELESVQRELQRARDHLDKQKQEVEKWKNCAGEQLALLQTRYETARKERLEEWHIKRAKLMAEWYRAQRTFRAELVDRYSNLNNVCCNAP